MVFQNVTIDNRNTSIIGYQGFWAHDGAYNATSVGETGTLSSTNDLNANFTIDTPPIFAFYYFGIKRSRGGFYQICIDCYPENRQWRNIDGLNSTDDGHNPPVVLFSTNWTIPLSHEIIVTNRPDTRFLNNNSQITLARLVYTIDDGSSASSPSPLPSPSPSTSTSTSTSTSPSGKSNGTVVAAIASSVSVGGSLLIIFIILLVLRRRSKQAAQVNWNANATGPMAQTYTRNVNSNEVDPFPPFLPQPVSPERPTKYQDLSSMNGASGHQNPSSLATNNPARSQLYGHPISSQSTVPQNMHIESALRREEDAGSIHGFSDYGETLPPDYEDATRRRRRMTREAL